MRNTGNARGNRQGTRVPYVRCLAFIKTRNLLEGWTPIERDAAHFLYALKRVGGEGRAVIQPPADTRTAAASYERVLRWFDDEDVPILAPEQLTDPQLVLEVAHA